MTPQEKVASIYEAAITGIETEKVAASYDVEHLPEHYKEALYKEAILPAIGAAVAGAGKNVGGRLSAASIKALKDPKMLKRVGGAASGAAALGTVGTGAVVGRATAPRQQQQQL